MTSPYFDQNYNEEVNLVDSLYEFHPEYFDALTSAERLALHNYYLYDSDTPEDIFKYRNEIIAGSPAIAVRARKALASLRRAGNM